MAAEAYGERTMADTGQPRARREASTDFLAHSSSNVTTEEGGMTGKSEYDALRRILLTD